jgi:hypothetical protein
LNGPFLFQSENFLYPNTADITSARWMIAVVGAIEAIYSRGSDVRLLCLEMGWHQRLLADPQKL